MEGGSLSGTWDRFAWWVVLCIAIAAGAVIAYIDSRPTWDDTGVTAGLLFVAAAVLGVLWPAHAWVWALAIGLWIPGCAVALHQDYAMLLVLLIPFAGAYLGAAVVRRPSLPKT